MQLGLLVGACLMQASLPRQLNKGFCWAPLLSGRAECCGSPVPMLFSLQHGGFIMLSVPWLGRPRALLRRVFVQGVQGAGVRGL